ncbi:MAG: hypothetical protein AB7H90_03425 [Alphaproteobacteria bacterium]
MEDKMEKFWLTSKTMMLGLAVAIGPAALDYMAGVDWTIFGISPAAGAVIGAVIMALRGVTVAPVTRHLKQR